MAKYAYQENFTEKKHVYFNAEKNQKPSRLKLDKFTFPGVIRSLIWFLWIILPSNTAIYQA